MWRRFAEAGYRILGRVVIAMSMQEAYDALDINPKSHFDLKKKYRDASRKNHPDLGGSTKEMQRVNEAYQFLKKGKGGWSSQDDADWSGDDSYWNTGRETPAARAERWAEQKKQDQHKLDLVQAVLKKEFKAVVYAKHFAKFFSEPLSYKFSEGFATSMTPSYYQKHEWVSQDRGTVFHLDIYVNAMDVVLKNMLGGTESGMGFKYTTDNAVYHNNRKQKMKRTTWDWSRTHSKDIVDPEPMFPSTTLKKVFTGQKQRKFAARDFREGLRKQLKAEVSYDDAWIDLGREGIFKLLIRRMVFMRQAHWMPNGIYQDRKRVWRPKKSLSIFETENSLKDIVEMTKTSKRTREDLASMTRLIESMMHHVDTRQHKEAGK